MPKFSVKKPLTVFVAVLAIVVLGVVAYLKMPPDLMPNMDFPYVILVTTDPGASPETVEADITKPLEQSMATLDRIKNVTSSSMDSVSMVVLEFEDGVNMDTVSVDIQQKINQLKGSWGDTVGDPYVLKMNPSMLPVQVAALSYDGKDITQLSDFVNDTLSPKLEGITGVASVTVSGTVERQLDVILSQKKLDALSQRLSDAIAKQLDDAAGQLASARGQVNSAKAAIRSAEESAVRDAVTQALTTIQDSLKTMRDSRDQLQDNLRELADIQREKARLEAENAPYQAKIEAIRQNPSMTEEEKQAAIAEIESDPEYVRIQAELAALDLRMAALGVKWDEAVQRAKEWQKQLEELEKQLRDLETDEGVAKLADQVSAGVLTMTDAVNQIISANIQLDSALSQIDQGLQTLEESRSTALSQADLSSSLSLPTITALLTAQNFSMPAGYLKEDGVNYMVSVGDSIDTRQDLEDLVLFDLGMDGIDPIRMKDVADVAITDNSSEIYDKLNGKDGVIVSLNKQSTYATAEVSDNINSRFRELEAEYEGLSFVPLMDQGDYIYLIINSILSSLGWGALFAVLILYLFLRDLRPTVITLCSIPISVIFAVVLMYFSGVTINMISLSGLAVAVGMLVDNSVVVIENIYRLRAKGATIIQAAVSGAGQVLGAVTASTLTTVCVFAPIVFVEGLTRQLFTDLALTITYSLLASLLVALTLVPAMASGMLRRPMVQKPGLLDKVYPAYRKAIAFSLDHKAGVLLLSLVLLVTSAGACLRRGFTFMPEMDMNNLSLTITMPEDTSREEAVRLADEVLERVMTVDDVQDAGFMMGGGTMGGLNMGGAMGGASGGSYDVEGYITMPEGTFGSVAGKEIETLCADLPCEVTASGVMSGMMSYMTGSGVSLQVFGSDMADLQSSARTIARRLEQVEGVSEVSDGLDASAPALQVTIDRTAAAEKGLTVAQVYMQIAAALQSSASVSDVTLDREDMDLTVDAAEGSVLKRENLLELELSAESSAASAMTGSASGSGTMGQLTGDSEEDKTFKLGDVATVTETVSMNTISRDQQRRCVTVTAAIADGYNVTHVTSAAQQAVSGLTLPEGVTAEFNGENEQIMEAMSQLLLMLLLGVVLVYFIMVAQFQSLKSPFIVMFTIPLAFTGGFLALLIAGIEVSVISLIGFVMLVGIIVNNGIVLVDYINQQRLSGMERREAIIDAGVTRLRPILMTSLTTILGLIVTATAKNAGTALMQPIAVVCIGGLLYATLMTLFVVPCMYDMMNKKDMQKVDESELQIVDM